MTTIATDGVTIAGDGRVTAGDRIVSDSAVKLVRLADGRVAGCCGDTSDCAAFVDWLASGQSGMISVSEDFGALVMLFNRSVQHFDADLSAVTCDLPIAIGSGGDAATGAMMAGAAPGQAVQIAARCDVYSGGVVTVMCCELAQ